MSRCGPSLPQACTPDMYCEMSTYMCTPCFNLCSPDLIGRRKQCHIQCSAFIETSKLESLTLPNVFPDDSSTTSSHRQLILSRRHLAIMMSMIIMMFCVAVIIVALFIRRYKIDESHRVDPMSKDIEEPYASCFVGGCCAMMKDKKPLKRECGDQRQPVAIPCEASLVDSTVPQGSDRRTPSDDEEPHYSMMGEIISQPSADINNVVHDDVQLRILEYSYDFIDRHDPVPKSLMSLDQDTTPKVGYSVTCECAAVVVQPQERYQRTYANINVGLPRFEQNEFPMSVQDEEPLSETLSHARQSREPLRGTELHASPIYQDISTQPIEESTSVGISLDLRSGSDISTHERHTQPSPSRGHSRTSNRSGEPFHHVMRAYDAFDANLHELSFARGCLIGNDELQVFVSDSRDQGECYDRLMNIIPSDVPLDVVLVEPETPRI